MTCLEAIAKQPRRKSSLLTYLHDVFSWPESLNQRTFLGTNLKEDLHEYLLEVKTKFLPLGLVR